MRIRLPLLTLALPRKTRGGGGGSIIVQGFRSTEATPTAAKSVTIDGSSISASATTASSGRGGEIAIHADTVTLQNSILTARGPGQGGTINLADVGTLKSTNSALDNSSQQGNGGAIILGSLETRSINLQNTTVSVHGKAGGGTINITASKQFQSVGTTLDASSLQGNGGTISIQAGRLSVTDGSTVTAQGAGPSQEGIIRFEFGKKLLVQDSVITPAATIISGWEGE